MAKRYINSNHLTLHHIMPDIWHFLLRFSDPECPFEYVNHGTIKANGNHICDVVKTNGGKSMEIIGTGYVEKILKNTFLFRAEDLEAFVVSRIQDYFLEKIQAGKVKKEHIPKFIILDRKVWHTTVFFCSDEYFSHTGLPTISQDYYINRNFSKTTEVEIKTRRGKTLNSSFVMLESLLGNKDVEIFPSLK